MLRNHYKLLRELAKGKKWQNILHLAKDTNSQLFKNNCDFSGLQLEFVDLLNYYSQIYMEVAMGEVIEQVLEDDIYIDSWFEYSREKRKREKEKKELLSNSKPKAKNFRSHTDSIIFTSNRKKKQ